MNEKQKREIKENIYHIHTKRCRHASLDDDRQYIEKAADLGVKSITFTDHTPFPDNPLDRRMRHEELEEYVSSLKTLKEEFKGTIDVSIGLEVEYMPAFHDYIRSLHESGDFDLLIIGQHFSQVDALAGVPHQLPMHEDSLYPTSERVRDAILSGIETGWFAGVAHPDRTFRADGDWDERMEKMAREIIDSAVSHKMFLEINMASMLKKNFFRPEFWELVPKEAAIVIGIDAHTVVDMAYRYTRMEELLEKNLYTLTTWQTNEAIRRPPAK